MKLTILFILLSFNLCFAQEVLPGTDYQEEASTLNEELRTIKKLAGKTVNLTTSMVSGVLPVANGGTNQSSWTQYLIPYANTTTSFSQIPIGTTGQVLTSNGAGSVASFQSLPNLTLQNATAATTYIEVSNDTERQGAGDGNWTKLKELSPIVRVGTYDVYYESKEGASEGYAQIYKNGSPSGTNRSLTGVYVAYNETISVYPGDVLSVYAMITPPNGAGIWVKNLRLRCSNPIVAQAVESY